MTTAPLLQALRLCLFLLLRGRSSSSGGGSSSSSGSSSGGVVIYRYYGTLLYSLHYNYPSLLLSLYLLAYQHALLPLGLHPRTYTYLQTWRPFPTASTTARAAVH